MKYFKYINYSRQSINSSDIKNVSQSLRDEFLTQGNKIIKFETNLRNFFKCKYSLAVSNGTAALFLSLKALNLKKNDSIIISPFTFVAAVNCCKLLNLKEKFIDIDPLTLNIDLNLVEKEIKKIAYSVKDNVLKKYVVENFLDKISNLTPIQTSKSRSQFKYFSQKKNFKILKETQILHNKRKNFSKVQIVEFSILFIISE